MSEQSPAQMPTAPQPCLKDTPIAVGSDSDSKTSTDTPFGDIFSNDGVCAKERGAAVEDYSSKRKVDQLQAHAAKKPRVSSPSTLHSGIVRQSCVGAKATRILARYNSNSMTTTEEGGYIENSVDILSWGSQNDVNALVEDGLLSKATNWALIPEQFKDALVTTAIEKNPLVLEFFSEQRKNELDHSLLVSAIQLAPWVYKYLSQQQKQRKDWVIRCLDSINGSLHQCELIENIPITFNDDIDVVLRLISNYGDERFDSEPCDFDEFQNPCEWCAPKLFSDPVFVMQAVKYDYGIMLHVMYHHTEIYERLQDNKPFVLLFIDIYTRQCFYRYNANPLEYVSGRLCDDTAVLMKVEAARGYWDTLDYASKRLCESPDFVIGILEDLDDDVDPDEVRKMLARNCPFLACDIDFIKRVIRDKGAEAICWFDEWFRKDNRKDNSSAVKAIIEVNPLVVAHVSADLQDTLDIIKPHFRDCPSDEILEFASKRVRDFVVSMKDLYVQYKEAGRRADSIGLETVYQMIIAKEDAFRKDKM